MGKAWHSTRPADILLTWGCAVEMGDRSNALALYEKLLEIDKDRAALLFQQIYP